MCTYVGMRNVKNKKIIFWYFTVVDNSSIFFYVYYVQFTFYVFRNHKPMVKNYNYNVYINIFQFIIRHIIIVHK